MPTTHHETRLPIANVGDFGGNVSPVKFSVPPGFMNARELFQHVLARLWGRRADGDLDVRADDVWVAMNDRIRSGEINLHWRDATQTIREAARRSKIEFLVQKSDGPKRLGYDRWAFGTDEYWENTLWQSEFLIPAPRELADHQGNALFVETGDAKAWIETLTSPWSLAKPLFRNPDNLPDIPLLHSVACWLAGQNDRDFFEFCEERAALRGLIADAERRAQLGQKPDEDQFSAIAEGSARLATISEACDLLMSAIRNGGLIVYGRKDEMSADQPIPRSVFQTDVRLDPLQDMLLPAARITDEQYARANMSGRWIDVSLQREELIRFFAVSDKPIASSSRKGAASSDNELPANRPRLPSARDWARKTASAWKPGDKKLGREKTIKSLMSEFELSREQAREVWNDMPQGIRRSRGHPGKS